MNRTVGWTFSLASGCVAICFVLAICTGAFIAVTRDSPSSSRSTTSHATVITYSVGNTSVIAQLHGDWTPEAASAFGLAAKTVAKSVDARVPIVVSADWTDLDDGTLGYGGPTDIYLNYPGAPQPDVYAPIALANQLHGSRLAEGTDIEISLNKNADWYFGLDGRPPEDKTDLVTTIIHEMLHGMGFSGTFDVDERNRGMWGVEGDAPFIRKLLPGTRPAHTHVPRLSKAVGYADVYDQWLVNGRGEKLLDTSLFPQGSRQLGRALQNDNLFWNGPAAKRANGGKPVKLYSPDPWEYSSSLSHLDDDTFDGGPEALMTSYGTRITSTNIGPITLGILVDMGWKLAGR